MRIVFRPEAEADRAEIHDHIAADSPARAVDRCVVIDRVLGGVVEIITIVHGSRDVDTAVRGMGA